MENAEDIEADVQADEISQLQGAHRMRHSQFHDSIYFLYTGYAFEEAADRFVDHGHQDAIGDEARVVIDDTGYFSQFFGEFYHLLGDGLICCISVDDLDEFHYGYGVHEMKADD